jgi:hypothetical protein
VASDERPAPPPGAASGSTAGTAPAAVAGEEPEVAREVRTIRSSTPRTPLAVSVAPLHAATTLRSDDQSDGCVLESAGFPGAAVSIWNGPSARRAPVARCVDGAEIEPPGAVGQRWARRRRDGAVLRLDRATRGSGLRVARAFAALFTAARTKSVPFTLARATASAPASATHRCLGETPCLNLTSSVLRSNLRARWGAFGRARE